MRNIIFSTIINPPLIAGVTGSFAFLILFLFFIASILVKAFLGVFGMLLCFVAIGALYVFGVKRTAHDPYWLNVLVMAAIFERKKPIDFVLRFVTKKDKIFYR